MYEVLVKAWPKSFLLIESDKENNPKANEPNLQAFELDDKTHLY